MTVIAPRKKTFGCPRTERSHLVLQIVALGLAYPSVVLIYFGEAAYLMNNTQDFAQSYFKVSATPPLTSATKATPSPRHMLASCFMYHATPRTSQSPTSRAFAPLLLHLLCLAPLLFALPL